MKIHFIKEIIHSKKKDKDFYVVRYALVDKNDNVVAKSDPLIWITKEIYDNLNI